MIVLLVILIITFLFILGAGLVFLKMFSPKKTVSEPQLGEQPQPVEKPDTKIRLRWSYFILPLAIRLVSVIITIYFDGKLPLQVVWQLNSVTSPTVSRGQIVLWAIVPQVLLALLAFLIAYGAPVAGS